MGLELSVYEDALMQRAEEKTARRKSQTQADIKPTWTVYYAQCGKDCHSGKGLCSHKKYTVLNHSPAAQRTLQSPRD